MTKTNLDTTKIWLKNSITLKLIVITFMIILLLIPQEMIETIIHERKTLRSAAIQEVSNKWAKKQQIDGPILTIPLVYTIDSDEIDKEKLTETKYLRVLPSDLKINGTISPKELRRGIYKVIVYQSDLDINGVIQIPKIKEENLIEVKWKDAHITVGISDLRGIKEDIKLKWGESILNIHSGSNISAIGSGITARIKNLNTKNNSPIPFSFNLNLQGSERLSFSPNGDVTVVNISSPWADPSFDGNFLPNIREISEDGFIASWKILEFNRNYPSAWYGQTYFSKMQESTFGVSLYSGIDNYQKSIRSAKYGAMIIALTFLTFFLIEVLYKRTTHPFQYALIGLALCLFFVLLVALSEHMPYEIAYVMGALSIIIMVSLYSLSVFRDKRMSFLLAVVLSLIYAFMYVTLQSADYALLIGSIGLTAILGATMYFTRNIDWYRSKESP
tara:strand:- start:545 stop:1879 length:1335 start_codon:yes stop_codon:yes gene_type:complete